MVGAGAGLAAHQDVSLQADNHQPGPRPGQPAEGGRDAGRLDEDVSGGNPTPLGQPSAGESKPRVRFMRLDKKKYKPRSPLYELSPDFCRCEYNEAVKYFSK